jgi:hypothetical protein
MIISLIFCLKHLEQGHQLAYTSDNIYSCHLELHYQFCGTVCNLCRALLESAETSNVHVVLHLDLW